jgi:curved DNA-binding protein CbpA
MPVGPQFDPYAVLQVVPTCEQEVVHAAFKALAMKYHPDRDGSRRAADRMAELNRAYALVRDADGRRSFDRSRRMTVAGVSVAANPAPPAAGASRANGAPAGASVLSFGRYSGWSLADLARRDPEYLLWLSRHSSGIRYRTEIYSLLRTMGVSAA